MQPQASIPNQDAKLPMGAHQSIVYLEGNIGAGKTCLLKKLKSYAEEQAKTDNCPLGVVTCMEETIDDALLALFYSDPPKYAFAMQLHTAEKRRHQMMRLRESHRIANEYEAKMKPLNTNSLARSLKEQEHSGWPRVPSGNGFLYEETLKKLSQISLERPKTDYVVVDRGVLGDYAFAITNYLTGSISENETVAYGNSMECNFFDVDKFIRLHSLHSKLILYLADGPENCKAKVDKSAERPIETKTISLDYYTLLDDVHFFLLIERALCNKLCKLKVCNPELGDGKDAYGKASEVWRSMHELASNPTLPASVARFATQEDGDFRNDKSQIYYGPDCANAIILLDKHLKAEKSYVAAGGKGARNGNSPEIFKRLCSLRQMPRGCKVFLPDGFMPAEINRCSQNDPSTPSDVTEMLRRATELGIRFHHPAYKRIVLWHLSLGHELVFYKQ